jgi:microcompartment protein CcmL/EutN
MAALGMIEVYGFATSIVVADAVAKAADVEVVAIDRNKPANADKCEVPLVMVVKFEGDPAAVQAAHDAGVAVAEERGLYITSKINAGLSPEVEWFAHLTATGRDKLRNLDTPAKKAPAKKAPAKKAPAKKAPVEEAKAETPAKE